MGNIFQLVSNGNLDKCLDYQNKKYKLPKRRMRYGNSINHDKYVNNGFVYDADKYIHDKKYKLFYEDDVCALKIALLSGRIQLPNDIFIKMGEYINHKNDKSFYGITYIINSCVDDDLEQEPKDIICSNVRIIDLFSTNGILTKNGEKTLMNNITQNIKCISKVKLLGRIIKIKNNTFYEYSDRIPISISHNEYSYYHEYEEIDQKGTYKIKNPYYKRK